MDHDRLFKELLTVRLKMLAHLQLDPARRELISGFVDSYLRLTIEQEQQFEAELQRLHPQEREEVMEIVTSWMERGFEQGLAHERKVLLHLLQKQVGDLDPSARQQIESLSADRLEQLAEAISGFTCRANVDAWLQSHP